MELFTKDGRLMKANNYLTIDDLYYSTVYGSGIYEWNRHEFVQDPLGGNNGKGLLSPLLTNLLTGESYFIKRINCNYTIHNKLKHRILNPPDRSNILWPSDMINLSDEQAAQCSLFVAQEYTEMPTPMNERKGNRALLFPYGGYPPMINGIRKLAQINQLSWKNPEIRNMAIQILHAMDSLNKCGYVYEDIHLSRFFFRDDGPAYLNYSNLVYSFKDFVSSDAITFCHVESGEYPIEFAEPAIVRGIQKNFDFNSQNYSLCALLFYLFFGQYCYDGRLLTGYVDDNIQKHYVKFRDYHKMPVFIFDPNDSQNALGAFDEEQQVIELWEECPPILRELFTLTLSQNNAERSGKVVNPPPSTWLRCFSQLGWITKKNKNKEDEA